MQLILKWVSVFGLGVFLLTAGASACPVCYGDLEPQQAKGFFWGIVFLGLLPFGLIGYIAGHVIHSARRKAKADLLIEQAEALIQKRVG
ncbi:MAG: hypothetical protein A3G34_08925 [Candidatus Lindowbacteria bacterium RIFCSPLOWO2_12_FULL_62_27]|nr:MAG: hypothetical protein A3I06_08785 [Candidatus Lindowbacteria bacterium RIFCSPLOWO2_02_FULL_62_12]OGH60820.1 MAG: hypothetical protein A3G34_08925 [Candidatus Lindowbacteria bacterium RIFCSPLOWO2_12_FULL_62_27]